MYPYGNREMDKLKNRLTEQVVYGIAYVVVKDNSVNLRGSVAIKKRGRTVYGAG
jgi:hypothetical protein